MLEVTIAALLLGIAVVGVAVMFSVGQGLVLGEGDNRVALFLAQQRLEQIRALGFDNALPTDASGNVDHITVPSATHIDENPVVTTPVCDPARGNCYRRHTSIVCIRDDEPTGTDYSCRCGESACNSTGATSCPTTAPFCPIGHNTRMVIVTVENLGAGSDADTTARSLTLRSVIARRCRLSASATAC